MAFNNLNKTKISWLILFEKHNIYKTLLYNNGRILNVYHPNISQPPLFDLRVFKMMEHVIFFFIYHINKYHYSYNACCTLSQCGAPPVLYCMTVTFEWINESIYALPKYVYYRHTILIVDGQYLYIIPPICACLLFIRPKLEILPNQVYIN